MLPYLLFLLSINYWARINRSQTLLCIFRGIIANSGLKKISTFIKEHGNDKGVECPIPVLYFYVPFTDLPTIPGAQKQTGTLEMRKARPKKAVTFFQGHTSGISRVNQSEVFLKLLCHTGRPRLPNWRLPNLVQTVPDCSYCDSLALLLKNFGDRLCRRVCSNWSWRKIVFKCFYYTRECPGLPEAVV